MAASANGDLLRDLGLPYQSVVDLGNVAVDPNQELGRGSDAAVYRVQWHGVDIALKVLHGLLIQPGNVGRRELILRFGQEILRLSKLHHPNLCQLVGIARVGHSPALAVELLERTLEQCSIGDGREPEPQLLSYLADTAAALRYLHSLRIIHRDLAPKNILVRNGVAKVCDFGVARCLHPEGPRQELQEAARMTACPGTMLFMPPEALLERAEYDEALDIFSFGVCLLSVWTGKLPSTELFIADRNRTVVQADGRSRREPIPEFERRSFDLELMAEGHPLKPTVLRCLRNQACDRPTAEEIHDVVKSAARLASDMNSPRRDPVSMATVLSQMSTLLKHVQEQQTAIAELAARQEETRLHVAGVNDRVVAMGRAMNSVTGNEYVAAISRQIQSLNQRFADTDERVRTIDERGSRMEQRISAIDSRSLDMEQRVAAVGDRSANIEQRVVTIDNRSSGMDQRITAIDNRSSDMERRVVAVDDRSANIEQRVTAIDNRSSGMDQKAAELGDSSARIEPQVAAVDKCSTRVEQGVAPIYDRANSIEQQLAEVIDGVSALNQKPVVPPTQSEATSDSDPFSPGQDQPPASPTKSEAPSHGDPEPFSSRQIQLAAISTQADAASDSDTPFIRQFRTAAGQAAGTRHSDRSSGRKSKKLRKAPSPPSPAATDMFVVVASQAGATSGTDPLSRRQAELERNSAHTEMTSQSDRLSTRRVRSRSSGNVNDDIAIQTDHLLICLTPQRIEQINQKSKWTQVTTGVDGEGESTNIVFDNTLVVFCSDKTGAITRIRQYSNLEGFQYFPTPEGTAFHPALAVHGNTLYMFCHEVARSPVILKITAEQGQAAGETGRWVKVTDVPYEVHRHCTMQATSTSITLLGGTDRSFSSKSHVSTFSFADSQWTSSANRFRRSLSQLPSSCRDASLLQCCCSQYVIGGLHGVFFQRDVGGKWRQAKMPGAANLSFSAACTLSEDCIAIATGLTCIVHNVVTQEVHELPRCGIAPAFPSLALFNDCLVLTGDGGEVWKLHMNV